MSILFGSDTGIELNAVGNFWEEIKSEFSRVADGFSGKLSSTNKPLPKETVYVDDGFMNVAGTAFVGSGVENLDDAKKRRITTQKPDVTVYIKKKLFWSLRNEHDTKFMDSGEKLFIRASKLLFERKCSQITAYESMTKLTSLLDEEAELDAEIMDSVVAGYAENLSIAMVDALEDEVSAASADPNRQFLADALGTQLDLLKNDVAKLDNAIQGLRDLAKDVRKTKSALTTSWVIDPEKNIDISRTGRGVGVIELTMTESFSTSLSLEYNDLGSISLTVEDPYNLMKITPSDVELALKSAYREMNNFDFSLGSNSAEALLSEARRKDNLLKMERESRFGSSGDSVVDAGVGEITFEINISSNAAHNIVGHVSSLPESFNSDNFNIILLKLSYEQRLTSTETNLVKGIFELLENYVREIVKISETAKIDGGDVDIKYARRQLRIFYLGKNIVQPMDGIHVYMRGRTFRDSELLGPLNHLLNGSSFVRSFATNAEASDAVLQEEMRQFNLDNAGIPLDLYRALRSGSLLRNAGTHIFGGLVSTVSESYNANSGKYILNVSGESNMKWLNLSKVNTAPSLDQPQGVLEDPLTPLDLKIDDATGLIIGNPGLSAENKKKLLYFDSGINKGEKVDESNIYQDIVIYGTRAYAKMKHAPGLVYKWKQGVITATRHINLRTQLDGNRSEIAKLRRDVGVTITTDPFANLDIADVVSLLITGFPHNYESFFLNTQSIGTYTTGGNTNDPESFFHSFFDITRSTNRALGNFQPFQTIHIDRKQMAKRLDLQTDLSNDNEEIKSLQSQIATLQDQLNVQNASYQEGDQTSLSSISRTGTISDLKNRIKKLKTKLKEEERLFTEKIKEGSNFGLRIYGDDIILEFANETAASNAEGVESSTKKLKTRSKLMQIRPQLNTKYNTDNNLFIVSDDYDKDLDLQAFAISLASSEIPIWNSTYKKPLETCINAAKVIDFELFCNSQGHIEFRPPRYNKIPLSLIVKMMLLSEEGVDIFPPFLKSLFLSREKSLEDTKEVVELEIAIIGLLLFGDESLDDKLFGQRTESIDLFLTSMVNTDTSNVSSQDVVKNIRDKRNDLARKIGSSNFADTEEENKKIAEEIDDLQNPKSSNVNSKRLQKFNKLLQLVSQKERAEETLKKLQSRNTKEGKFGSLLEEKTSGSGKALNTGEMATLLEPFGDLIEDDYNDFIGPGSAKRFIIYDDQIISYDFKESDSNVYCRVDVTGQEDLLGGKPGEVGGIPLIWAGATDFDLWKQYGWRSGDTAVKPFFKDAENQCAPYALMLLSRKRRDTVRANLTLVGNEYYQLGDVVYINSRDMLYYVYAVRHSFSYSSGTYTTQLDLRYGHPLGEFIPTPLDVIGKNFIKNQRKFNTTFMFRKTAGSDIGRLSGVILFNNPNVLTTGELRTEMLSGDLGVENLNELKRCLLKINAQIGKDIAVEIRGYVSSEDETEKQKVKSRMAAVQEWLENPISGFGSTSGEEITLSREFYSPIEKNIIRKFDSDNDPINLVNMTDDNKAFGRTAREETRNVSQSDTDISAVEIIIIFPETIQV